jgi:hypothetical protein
VPGIAIEHIGATATSSMALQFGTTAPFGRFQEGGLVQ